MAQLSVAWLMSEDHRADREDNRANPDINGGFLLGIDWRRCHDRDNRTVNNRFLPRQDRRSLRSNAAAWLARSRNNEWARPRGRRGAIGAAISRVPAPFAGSGYRHTKFGGSDVCPSLIERIPEYDDHRLICCRVGDLCAGYVSVSPKPDLTDRFKLYACA
jgi:hypothetical protein